MRFDSGLILAPVASFLAALLPLSSALGAEPAAEPIGRAFRVGKVVTMDDAARVVNGAVVLVRDGRFEKIGKAKETEIPEGYEVQDHGDLWLFPGFVDAHNHTVSSIMDLNDMVYLTNPGLETLETLTPEGTEAKHAKTGGVTTVLLVPGSGTNLSGNGTIAKTAGSTVDEIAVKSPGVLKVAQAGNPESYWYGVGRSFMNYNLRQTLQKAKEYHLAWKRHESGETKEKPRFDPIWHSLRGVFEKESVVCVHTQMYQVVMMSVLMLSRDFGLHIILNHSCFDAWKVAPIFKDMKDIYTIEGPRQFHFDTTQRKMMGPAARWWQGGIRELGINTDAVYRRGITQEDLTYQAAMACWYGWEPYLALRGITRVTSKSLKLDEKIGSVEVGKEADFALWTGDPLDPRSYCFLTVIRGRIVHDSRKGRTF